jgi:hypothetical protein
MVEDGADINEPCFLESRRDVLSSSERTSASLPSDNEDCAWPSGSDRESDASVPGMGRQILPRPHGSLTCSSVTFSSRAIHSTRRAQQVAVPRQPKQRLPCSQQSGRRR